MSTTRILKQPKATKKTVRALMALKKGKTDPQQIPVHIARHILSFIDTPEEREQIKKGENAFYTLESFWSYLPESRHRTPDAGWSARNDLEIFVRFVASPIPLMVDGCKFFQRKINDKGLASLDLFTKPSGKKESVLLRR